jgi:hypothetical protein
MQELATFCDKLCIKKVPYYTGGKDMRSVSDISNEFKKLHNNKNIFSKFRSNYLKNDHPLNWILFLIIIYGLYLKFQSLLSIPLSSDSIFAGLSCREIFEHGNYFLKGYYLPFSDPLIFSELPFHALPQLLTRYDPKALLLSSYSIYLAVICIYSVLIYNMTKKITNSLIFASVLANIPNNADSFITIPTIHMATILFIGILLLIYRQAINGKLSAIFYLLVLALVSFSDSLLILWYFIPFFLANALLNKPFELKKMNFLFISGITVLLAYLVKKFIKTFVVTPIHLITSKEQLFDNVVLFFKGICLLYNNELYEFSNTYKLNIYTIIAIIITIGIMYFVFSNISKRFSTNSIWLLFVFLSITFISIIYVFTSISIDINTTRYLTFPLILSIGILALTYNQNMKFRRIYIFLFLSLIIMNSVSNAEILKGEHNNPNREQYELIDYLKGSNLTFGYGNYWDSNIITYLSKEKIIIRPIKFHFRHNPYTIERNESLSSRDAMIRPYMWLSCERWFTELPKTNGNFFIIQSQFQKEENENFVHKNPPKKILEFRNYKIYVYDIPKMK